MLKGIKNIIWLSKIGREAICNQEIRIKRLEIGLDELRARVDVLAETLDNAGADFDELVDDVTELETKLDVLKGNRYVLAEYDDDVDLGELALEIDEINNRLGGEQQ